MEKKECWKEKFGNSSIVLFQFNSFRCHRKIIGLPVCWRWSAGRGTNNLFSYIRILLPPDTWWHVRHVQGMWTKFQKGTGLLFWRSLCELWFRCSCQRCGSFCTLSFHWKPFWTLGSSDGDNCRDHDINIADCIWVFARYFLIRLCPLQWCIKKIIALLSLILFS